MESNKSHNSTLPQQNLTLSAEGFPSGPRPEDLILGGPEGANPHAGQQVTIEAADSAAAGSLQPPRVIASLQGDEIRKILTRLDVFKMFSNTTKKMSLVDRVNVVFDHFGTNYDISTTREDFGPILATFLCKSDTKYKKCNYMMKRFTENNKDWLSYELISGQFKGATESVEGSPEVIPSTDNSNSFLNLSTRQQLRSRRKLETVLHEEPLMKKIKAFSASLSVDGKPLTSKAAKTIEKVVYSCLKTEKAHEIVLNKIEKHTQPYTPEEALAIVIDRKLSVETYNFLRLDLQEHGFDAFPPYYKVQESRKSCYPSDVTVSEREASVPAQALLQHTFERILQLNDEVVMQFCNQNALEDLECTLQGNWGFDGSTGQSFYKQAFSDVEGGEENSLLATTLIPLVLKTTKGHILWKNPAPQSYRYCRPLHVQYRKETKESTLSEKARIENQIHNLTPLLGKTSKGHKIKVSCELYLAAIDGKVLNTILNTTSQMRCPYCGLTATQFNDIDAALEQPVKKEALKHGVSPLHAWIRTLEFLLHLAYKKVVKMWRIPQKSEQKRLVDARKKEIQNQLRDKMGLLVDVVRPNSGTTNDGNTARTALSDKNRQIFSEILDVEKWLLDDLHVILTVMSSELPIDDNKFAEFCKQLAYKYVESYPWHPMTVTLHKIWMHGAEIIRSTTLPIGMLSEQASESRNKYWRSDREHHCRKMDRIKTMTDLFHRALESSDPLISNARLRTRKKQQHRIPLPEAARKLLKAVANPDSLERLNSIDETQNFDFDESVVLRNEENI